MTDRVVDLPSVAISAVHEMMSAVDDDNHIRLFELLADHVSDAFSPDRLGIDIHARIVRLSLDNHATHSDDGGDASETDSPDVLRIEIDDLQLFWLAALRPTRIGGWSSMVLNADADPTSCVDRIAAPLVLSEDPTKHVHDGALVEGLQALLTRTRSAANHRCAPFHHFWDSLGTVLYYANPDGVLLRALDKEIRRVMPCERDTLVALQSFPALRSSLGSPRPQKGIGSVQTSRIMNQTVLKLRVHPDYAPKGSGLRPIDPAEIVRDQCDHMIVCMDVSARCTIDGALHSILVIHVKRDSLLLGSACGNVEPSDGVADTTDPEEMMRALALRACTEFVEEVGSFHDHDHPMMEVRDGVFYLQGRHRVTPIIYELHEQERGRGHRRVGVLNFSIHFGDVDSVSDVAEALCGGVPRDVGFESAGRRIFTRRVHAWGTPEAMRVVDEKIENARCFGGFPLSIMCVLCLSPMLLYPTGPVLERLRGLCDFKYHSEDGYFTPPPPQPRERPRLKLAKRTTLAPVGGQPGTGMFG